MSMKKKERKRRTFLLEDWVTDIDTGKWIHVGITDGKVYLDGRARYQLRTSDIKEEEEGKDEDEEKEDEEEAVEKDTEEREKERE